MNFYFLTMFYCVVILLFNLLFNQQKHVDKGELLMSNLTLWDQLKEAKSEKYKWVDLTHELSPETPHWYGFSPLQADLLFDYAEGTPEDKMAPMRCFQYSIASQYGTHVDAPRHFWGNGRPMNEITVKELVYPLVVIDKSAECAADPDFVLKIEDIQKWEEECGRIPEGAFVAFRSDWYKKSNLDNPDENGQPHYPGWDKAAIQWLVENRNIGAIGHEPADTDPATVTTKPDAYPYPGEQYILEVDRFQIEVMRNLDQVPAVGSLIVCAFPKLKDGVGFPARCFAICPAD
jgi:kynurenine formamidase